MLSAPASTALLEHLGRPAREAPESAQHDAARRFLARSDVEALIRRDDRGLIVAAAVVVFLPRLGHPGDEARLLDLVVADELRGQGIGRELVCWTANLARDRGCHLLRLECGHQRTDAHRFYERLGFRDAGRDYQLALR